ncbi:MAG: PTS sugar transporter subunit IIA [Myxococcota bacterium]
MAVERMSLDFAADTKREALEQLADLFTDLDREAVIAALEAREALASTGVGSGVAIPHGRVPGVDRVRAAVAICGAGVDFEAIDGEPVRIFVALLAPEGGAGEHLRALARFSRVLRNEATRSAILAAQDAAQVFEIFDRSDR